MKNIHQTSYSTLASRSARRTLGAAALLFVASVLACWILPYRMRFEPGGSYYTCAYITDEFHYLARIQPLLPGATATNPINGICDPAARSLFYLEDACRAAVSLLGCDVLAFAWAWRLLTPVVLALCFAGCARCLLERTRRPWAGALRWSAAAAALPVFFCLVDSAMLRIPGPPHVWLNRVPTNVDFLLAVPLLTVLVRFIQAPSPGRSLALAAVSLALIHLRFYAAFPFGLAIGAALLMMLATRRLRPSLFAFTVGLVAVGMIPWVLNLLANRNSEGHRDMLARYFYARPYAVHDQWPIYLGAASLFLLGAWLARERRGRAESPAHGRTRVFALSCAFAMAALPFVCGIPALIRREMLLSDRFVSFYATALLVLGLLVLSDKSLEWRGRRAPAMARRYSGGLMAAGFLAAALQAAVNLRYDFRGYVNNQYASIVDDAHYLPAYDWVRAHTEADALFLVDDGCDWSRMPREREQLDEMEDRLSCHNDHFLIAARRRRVYVEDVFLRGNAVVSADADALLRLQRGAFGMPLPKDFVLQALRRFKPGYILWRKRPPVVLETGPAAIPRGWPKELKESGEIRFEQVYDDPACTIWKILY